MHFCTHWRPRQLPPRNTPNLCQETEKLRQGTQIATESLFADQTWVQKEMDDKMIVNARLKKECPKLETRQRTGDSYLS